MWQIFPLLETFRSNLALCSCWSSQNILKCSRILWGFFFSKMAKCDDMKIYFCQWRVSSHLLLTKHLYDFGPPSSYNLEPDGFLGVWNRHILGLLLGYCFSSLSKDGVLFGSLWDFVAGLDDVRGAVHSMAPPAADGEGGAPSEVPRAALVRSSAAQASAQPWTQVSQHWTLCFLAQTAILAQASSQAIFFSIAQLGFLEKLFSWSHLTYFHVSCTPKSWSCTI